MSRKYLTIKEYCEKYNVPRTTVQSWIKSGILEAITFKRPFRIPDDQGVPVKDPSYHRWYYTFKPK